MTTVCATLATSPPNSVTKTILLTAVGMALWRLKATGIIARRIISVMGFLKLGLITAIVIVLLSVPTTKLLSKTANLVIAAAGDIACAPQKTASQKICQMQATADLLGKVKPVAVLPLGDNQFALQSPEGVANNKGVRQFVVGSGGRNHYAFKTIRANSQVRNNDTYGVLFLTLAPTSYQWEFVPVAGQTFTDSGTNSCF